MSRIRRFGAICAFLVLLTLPCTARPQVSPPQDPGWPRQFVNNGVTLVIFQPQIDDWSNHTNLKGRAAFTLRPTNGRTTPGVVSFEAITDTDRTNRTVFLHDVRYTSVRFPSLAAQDAAQMEQTFRSLAPTSPQPISLDRLMADVDRSKVATRTPPLKTDPPTIFYSTAPAILLIVRGQPVLSPIEGTNLEFVVNTNWNLFFDKSEKRYYLLENEFWLTSTALDGPWSSTETLPKDMSKLPDSQNWDAVRKMIPPRPPPRTVPHVYFTSTPAELLATNGVAVYTRVPGTQLLYVNNTEDDIFLNDADRLFYVLISGRWFRAPTLNGAWTFVGNSLPEDFRKIPEDSPKEHVLASVPGTIQASDAVLLAQIPTTVTVNKAQAESQVKVTYSGAPQFQPIPGTNLQYAVNSENEVIKVGSSYYLCLNGIWFTSGSATGPWKTADSVPNEIYNIPPSSPVYNVTYVTQTNPTATTVESSSTDGYLGVFVLGAALGAAICYGTGYYYPPYFYFGGPYPYFRPWPMTYGVGVAYNPWTGGWVAGRAAYGPFAAAGSAAWFNPATGRFGHAATVQGWYGGRTVANAYNPWTGGRAITSQGRSPYAQWGSTVATRNGQAIQTGHITTAGGTTAAGYRTSTGQHGGVITGPNGTVARGPNSTFAGNDGNVYRKDSNGNWSQYNNGSWSPVDTSQAKQNFNNAHPNAQNNIHNAQDARATTMDGLNRSAAARQRGQFQEQRFRVFANGGPGRSRMRR